MNTLVLGDTEYQLDRPYRAGAYAARRGIIYYANPHRSGSAAHDQWNAGHVHESEGAHKGFGIDILRVRPERGRTWINRNPS